MEIPMNLIKPGDADAKRGELLDWRCDLELAWWRKIPMRAIRHLVAYLEHDERKDYEGYLDADGKVIEATAKEAKSHIHNHVRRVADWLDSLSADSNRNCNTTEKANVTRV